MYWYKYGDYSNSYSYGGSSNWRWGGSVTEWASKWTYVKPDSQKIKDALMVEQKKMNAKGVPIKISYGQASVMRKKYGVSRVTLDNTNLVKKMQVFLARTRDIWVLELWAKDSRVFQSLIGKHNTWEVDWCRSDNWDILDNMENYLKVRDWFTEPKWDKPNPNATTWWWSGRGLVLEALDLVKCNSIGQSIKNKIRMPDMIRIKEQSTRRWQRINRSFVNQTSYKPLQNQYDYKIKPKKALAILDTSWSMSRVHATASEFMEWLKVSWVFQTSAYYSEDSCIYKSDGMNRLHVWGWEWFNLLLNRLEIAWENYSEYDYIFVFTDLNIGNNEINELCTMLKGKKHILFNLNTSGDINSYRESYPDLKIIQAFHLNDMIQTLINYV